MTSTGLLALILAAASGGANPDGGAPPAGVVAPALEREATPPPAPPPPAPAPARRRTAPEVERPRNRHVPPPYTNRTTSPMLDSSRSTIEPDREALPHDLQDMRLAPYGPAPPELTPTQEGGGPKRVEDIHAPPANAAGTGGHGGDAAPARVPLVTPPAASAPDPRRTP